MDHDDRLGLLRRLMIASLLFWSATGSTAQADDPFVGSSPSHFIHPEIPGLQMPTDVAIAPDGSVFVADGANNRIVRFGADGKWIEDIREIGGSSLLHPLGLDYHPTGGLWIADSGNHRAIQMKPDGSAGRVLAPVADANEYPADVTDIAVTADGNTVWLADNDNHRLIRWSLGNDGPVRVGRRGESLGQLYHPFMLALNPGGDVLITDVMNGRIAAFSAAGATLESIGAYGIDMGQMYRPKGVVTDADGNVWVTDGTLNVVQVFTQDGAPIDALRGNDGRPLTFAFPMGITFDAQGRLYVTELLANRVTRVVINRGDAQSRPRPSARRTSVVGGQARSCTVCHIEWIEPFSRGMPTALAAAPATSDEEPAAGRSETCLSCHDGSVVDSRHRVWDSHGHRTGIEPPRDMKVPNHLPLVGGKIACRTCHSAHTGGRFDADFRTAVFLRVPNQASELCISCHQDMTRGPEFGTHPVGGMPWVIPQKLVDAGARVGPNPRELTCQVCHTPHGSSVDHLLVMGTTSNQLCLTCHDRMRPGMFRDGPHVEHPLSPAVNSEQLTAIHQLGTKVGDEGRLICLSCHKLHHGKGERFMLADDLTDGRFCIRCHSEKTNVLGSSHDLRTNFPQEKNRLGMTPASGGPCSACHMFHRYARAPEPSTLDPGGGKCITCHQEGRCAGAKILGPVNHPGTHCVDCHNPHDPVFKPYLRGHAADVCSNCHANSDALVGGPHDYRTTSTAWPEESVAKQDRCLVCHRPHGDEETRLLRFADGGVGADAGCRVCHASETWGSTGDTAVAHSQKMDPRRDHGNLPLAILDEAGTRGVGCRTCHNPHASIKHDPHLLRIADGQTTVDMCKQCHVKTSHIQLTAHGSAGLTSAGFDAASCRPCHSMHANKSTLSDRLLWPRDLTAPVMPKNPANRYCAACHRADGPAKPPVIAGHPRIVMRAIASLPVGESLPLYDENGRASSDGRIACATCHLPHGQTMSGNEADRLAAGSRQQRRAARLLLRPFNAPNLCTTCHGADGLRRFLYFHDPLRRGGPLSSPRGPVDRSGDINVRVAP